MTKLKLQYLLAATLLATINMAAAAEPLSPLHYGDELNRCIAEVRAELGNTAATRMRHSVTDIDKSGAWYIFAIDSEVLADDDSVSATVSSQCRSNRYSATTRIEKITVDATAAQLAQSR